MARRKEGKEVKDRGMEEINVRKRKQSMKEGGKGRLKN